MEILQAEQIRKSFDGNEVMKGIFYSVNKGEVLAIIGPSGSGKSTFLRCVTQLETVDSGAITLCGETLVKNGPDGKAVYADKATCSRIVCALAWCFRILICSRIFLCCAILRKLRPCAGKEAGGGGDNRARAIEKK